MTVDIIVEKYQDAEAGRVADVRKIGKRAVHPAAEKIADRDAESIADGVGGIPPSGQVGLDRDVVAACGVSARLWPNAAIRRPIAHDLDDALPVGDVGATAGGVPDQR